MRYYEGGVMDDSLANGCACKSCLISGPDCLNGQLLAVGYGTDPVGGKYWLLKVRFEDDSVVP